MKYTARSQNLRVDFWIDERFDPEKSTYGALSYLKELYYYFNDWSLALSAYNRGENGIGRDLRFSRATDFTKLSRRNAIPRETENYVPQFMAVAIIAKNMEQYGFKKPEQSPITYDVYQTDEMIDLEVAAKCAETTKKEIQKLNPAVSAWCTPKNYPGFELKIPYGTKDLFEANLKKVPELCPTREFVKYRIKKGDYLGKIAKLYKCSVSSLKNDNNIKDERRLMPGQVLIVKPGHGYYK
jgi:membrane-bound lytic murein transglycosylase D